jgi:aspartyl-tRNA synthetase
MQEGYLKRLMKEVKGIDIETPFPRLSWDEAMERYGSDKPDTRFGFELKKLNDLFEGCSFRVFSDCLASGGDIRGICIDGGAGLYSRKKIDKLAEQIRSYGAGGLIWIKPGEDGFSSSINKFFSDEELQRVADRFGAGSGDLILIVADKRQVTWDALGYLRRHIASEMGLLDQEQFNFLWVVDFPVFEWSDEEGRYLAMHHPFTAPKEEDLDLIESDPGRARARAYDVVLNGVELGGGSIRIHDREVQQRMFRALGLSEEEIEEKFGFLVEAFRYGAPPHGGLAYGLDRMVMLLAGKNSIREVIAFPKNQAAQCMVSGAPAPADEQSLAELGLKLR